MIDNDPRPIPEFKCDTPNVVRVLHFLSGFLTILVGLIFIGEEMNAQPRCQGQGCIGPSLSWGSGFNTNSGLNTGWRNVFSLQPSALVENWTPVFFGLFSVTAHFPGFNYSFITKTWFHAGAWNIFLAVFGHLGYGGNIGIIFGMFAAVVGLICVIMQFTPWRNERPQLHLTLGSCFDRFQFVVDNEIVLNFARGLGLALGIASIVNGIVYFVNRNFDWCPMGAYTECLGPSLRWNNGQAGQGFVDDANASGWRTVFTFNPEYFIPLWGPVILGYLTLIQHLREKPWGFYASWPRVFVWFMFVGLFGNMGYSGSLGVLIGFFCLFQAFLAFFISIAGGSTTRTHFQLKIKFLE